MGSLLVWKYIYRTETTCFIVNGVHVSPCKANIKAVKSVTNGQIDKQIDKHTYRQPERETDRKKLIQGLLISDSLMNDT